jgi:transposase
MKIPVKFVSPLTEEQTNQLTEMLKHGEKPRPRLRAQAILWSSKAVSIDDIAQRCAVDRDTVSTWIEKWEQAGLAGLIDKPRSGNPGRLTTAETALVLELAKEHPRSVVSIRAALLEQTGKRVSESTLKRILKAAGLTWKRIRKTMTDRRNDDEFKAAQQSISEYRTQHEEGQIELWFFDETGFDLQPSVPYAWQPVGETLEIPSKPSRRLNVLGFLTVDNRYESFYVTGSVNTDVVIACFDAFAKMDCTIPRVVLLDNASVHTSHSFLNRLPQWEAQGVFVRYLPAYSSSLNLIEILWRFIKYHWLPFEAYLSFDNLVSSVEQILAQLGETFRINFAS